MNFFKENDVPYFVYGTAWKEDQTADLVHLALEQGFRAIDTANQRKHYHEQGVGEGLARAYGEGIVNRSDIFLQTKFTYERGQDHRLPYESDASVDEQVRQSLESSLEHLDTEYIESLVLHGPSSRDGLGEKDHTVWQTFEELVRTDKVGSIGVSNVTPDQLQELIDFADVPPACVQNRCFARTAWDRPTRTICDRNDITYQGFSLLTANIKDLKTNAVQQIARSHQKTLPQVVFRFALQIGMLPLTGTTDKEHMQEDLACRHFDLSEEQIQTLEEIAL